MLGFVLAAGLGWMTPQIHNALEQPVIKAVSYKITLKDGEERLIGFVIVLLIAAVLAALLNSGSALGIAIGCVLGYFGPRLIDLAKQTQSS